MSCAVSRKIAKFQQHRTHVKNIGTCPQFAFTCQDNGNCRHFAYGVLQKKLVPVCVFTRFPVLFLLNVSACVPRMRSSACSRISVGVASVFRPASTRLANHHSITHPISPSSKLPTPHTPPKQAYALSAHFFLICCSLVFVASGGGQEKGNGQQSFGSRMFLTP